MNLDTDIIAFEKISSKWITDLNVKCKAIKLLEDKQEKNLDDLESGDDYLDSTPTTWFIKDIIDKLHSIKIKKLMSFAL